MSVPKLKVIYIPQMNPPPPKKKQDSMLLFEQSHLYQQSVQIFLAHCERPSLKCPYLSIKQSIEWQEGEAYEGIC